MYIIQSESRLLCRSAATSHLSSTTATAKSYIPACFVVLSASPPPPMRSEKPVVFYTVDKQQINLQSFHLLAYSAFFIYSCSSGKFASYVQLTKQISEQLYKLEKTMANQSSPQTIATTNTVNTTLLLLHRTTCVSQLHSYELKASAAAKFYSPLASSAIILKKKN